MFFSHSICSCCFIFLSVPQFVTGGNDHSVIIFDRSSNNVIATLDNHTKAVTDVLFHPEEPTLFSASADHTACVWIAESDG